MPTQKLIQQKILQNDIKSPYNNMIDCPDCKKKYFRNGRWICPKCFNMFIENCIKDLMEE